MVALSTEDLFDEAYRQYARALMEEFGLAELPKLEPATANEEVIFRIVTVVPPEVLNDRRRLLDREARVHDQVERADPKLVGRFSLIYRPVDAAA